VLSQLPPAFCVFRGTLDLQDIRSCCTLSVGYVAQEGRPEEVRDMGLARPAVAPPAAEFLTIDQACAALQLARPALMRAVAAGTIPAAKVGGVYRIRRADLDSLAAGAKPAPTAATAAPCRS
jgi:excisionase family DNA binding protein